MSGSEQPAQASAQTRSMGIPVPVPPAPPAGAATLPSVAQETKMSRAGPGIPESSSSGVSVGTDDGLSSGTGAVAVSVDPPHHTSAAGLTPSQTPPGPSLPDSVQPEDGLQGLTLEPRQQPKQQEQLRAGAVVAGHQPSGKTAKQGSGLPQPQPSLTAAAQPPHRNGSLEAQGRKLPASFDPSTCRTLYIGNLHPYINESMLHEVFSQAGGTTTEVKIIKDKQTGHNAGYGFVKLVDHHNAETAMNQLNNATLYGQEIRVNWAFTSNHRDDGNANVHIFVGDLSNEVSDHALFAAFSSVGDCTEARVMWDHITGRSKGYGFVSFKTNEDAERGIQKMNGEMLGGRRIRCGWAQHKQDAAIPLDASSIDRTDPTNTNVYIGSISPEVTDLELQRHFSAFGTIMEFKQHKKGGYAFVRYQMHEEAVRAICEMNGKSLGAKAIKCSWGRNTNGMHQGMMSTGMGMGAGSLGVSNMMLGLTAGMQHMGPLIGTQAHGHGHNPGILAGAQHMMMSQPHVAALQSMVHDPAMQAALLAAVGQPMAAAAMGMQPQGMMMQQSQGMSGFPMATQAHGSMPIPHTANMYYGLYYK